MAQHTGEPLYKCPFCPRTFNSNANMHITCQTRNATFSARSVAKDSHAGISWNCIRAHMFQPTNASSSVKSVLNTMR